MKSALVVTLFTILSLVGVSAVVQADCAQNRRITVHAVPGTGEINVTPETYVDSRGCDFDIYVPAGYTTNIISDEADWLNGSASGGSIPISIPSDAASDDYKYDVEIVGFGRKDPYVRVN